MNEKLAFNTTEAAELLGVSRPTVYKLMAHDGLPFVMAGGRRLIPKAGLEAWLAAKASNGSHN